MAILIVDLNTNKWGKREKNMASYPKDGSTWLDNQKPSLRSNSGAYVYVPNIEVLVKAGCLFPQIW